jgi:glycosyltransferase involved in cell wall biosynthesis
MIKHFPKVLILGHSFNENSGIGITLTNLFKDWPQENIAVAAFNINLDYCNKFRPCIKYFDFGHNESKDINKTNDHNIKKNKLTNFIRYFLKEKLGLLDVMPEKRLSNNFLNFIDSFNPEIIYTALGNFKEMKFIINLMKFRNIPLAIHIMDDWPVTLYNKRYLKFYWEYIYDKNFRKILSISRVNLSICQTMSDEYLNRYGVDFIPFHNPIDPQLWESVPFNTNQKCKSVIYVGKINKDTEANLITMCQVIHSLSFEGYDIKFEVYTPNYTEDKIKLFSKYKNCYVYNTVSQNEIPKLLRSASILFLTLGFDKHSLNYTRLSMPTKLTEYLISKVPILLYCPKEIALYKYCSDNNCAAWSDNGKKNLYNTLKYLINDSELQKNITENAYKLVVSRHSTSIVREDFRKVLAKAIDI